MATIDSFECADGKKNNKKTSVICLFKTTMTPVAVQIIKIMPLKSRECGFFIAYLKVSRSDRTSNLPLLPKLLPACYLMCT